MYQAIQVQEGQYYAKVLDGPGRGMLWEVKSVSARFLSLPHALLVNQEDPRDIRMFSCDTIADGRLFKLLSEPQRQHTLAPSHIWFCANSWKSFRLARRFRPLLGVIVSPLLEVARRGQQAFGQFATVLAAFR